MGGDPRAAPVGERMSRKLMIAWKGETRTIDEWVAITGIGKQTLKSRMQNGWPMDQAMTRQVGGRRNWRATITSPEVRDRMHDLNSCPCSQCRPLRAQVRPRTPEERAARMARETAARRLAKSLETLE